MSNSLKWVDTDFKFFSMKKLSLLKLNDSKNLQPDELKRIKGGSCSAWLCQCHGSWSDGDGAQTVDNTLEYNDKYGYL